MQYSDPMRTSLRLTLFVSTAWLLTATLHAQPDRISARINGSRRVALLGHVPARARAAVDEGPVDSSFRMPALTMYLKPSAGQQASLRQLLAGQQNPASADFHRWLSPEQYADRFGASRSDVNRIASWLQSQGFRVQSVARSRTWIQFSGDAQLVDNTFHTQIHQYLEHGRLHYANATDPSIPEALSGLVRGFGGLHNFRLKPRSRVSQRPAYTTSSGDHQIAPDDFATIYNVAPLYDAGIDGTGQTLVVVGQTDINLSDIQTFRSKYNLPVMDPKLVLVPRSDPGISQDDLPEADLDVEWAGAVARKATILYVYSNDVTTSLQYAIDNTLAPVISMSYGLCEGADLIDLPTYRSFALQANAEGITWLAASGDNGAADCEDAGATVAQDGLAVDVPASVPEVTAMGGTEFNEGGGAYWGDTNTVNGASALSYIPERAWNDTNLGGGLAAGGGGTSLFFPKPIWQAGPGVPSDSYRHVPDVSIASSADHDGYYVYTGNKLQIYGGTSMAAPTMAGIVTLLNHYLASTGAKQQAGLGNINPALYRLAQNVSGVFHDVTVGDNSVPCVSGSPNCTTGTVGYSAAATYDRATGLGSPDASNLIHQWSSQPPTETAAVVPSIDQNPVFEQTLNRGANPWMFQITLTEEAGVATSLTSFTINGQPSDVATVFGATSISAGGSVSSKGLGLANLTVPTNVIFGFTGTDVNGHSWSQQLSIPFEGPQTPLVVGGASNAATGQQAFAPGMLVSVYGTALGNFAQSAGAIPLPQYLAGFEAWVNGVLAPLYYVSPNQVNLQIPYETQTGTATLTVGNPYVNVDYKIQIVPATPGIFMTNGFTAAPFSSAARGKITTLFITGEGQVTPSLTSGTSPAASTPLARLPKPRLPVTVTVANEAATVDFIGIPPGLVGVTQINYEVPADAPLGAQPVVVTVGGVASPPANLTVTQ
jgi:uncharacterized protein (TIGR03437 family)